MRKETSSSPSKVCIVSLGCPKNLVDSEQMVGLLAAAGMELTVSRDLADFVIINTCSFLAEARQEAEAAIREYSGSRPDGQKLVVAGCLVAHRGRELLRAFPDVDAFIHPSAIPGIIPAVRSMMSDELRDRYVCRRGSFSGELPRRRLTLPHTAYVRIADGCDNRCSYCTVPSIRGPFRSSPAEAVVEEVRRLVGEGVVEVNLIAQDTTSYGKDIHGGRSLASLLRRLCAIEGLSWLRLLYAHPAHFDGDLIEVLREEPALCEYIDLPLQHISDRILESMGRGVTSAGARRLVASLRGSIPSAAIRTTVIVGYPGETEGEFEELLGFLAEARFERLGAFAYSREPGTVAFGLPGQIDDDVKEERLHTVMSLQGSISRELNESLLGREVDVLVDATLSEGGYSSVGRTRRHAPDVDGHVFITGDGAAPGEIVRATIVGAGDYDLIGEV